jgi:hypothetical protein
LARQVLVVLVLVLSAIFGAADQYLGSLPGAHLWAAFGYRWHTKRAWLGPLLVAGAFCLEPLARVTAGHGQEIGARTVWVLEVAVGLAFAAYVAVATRRHVPDRAC